MSTRELHQWITLGQRWECDEYDHGPMCRRCRQVDKWSVKKERGETSESTTSR